MSSERVKRTEPFAPAPLARLVETWASSATAEAIPAIARNQCGRIRSKRCSID
jgi:hypothetical protein